MIDLPVVRPIFRISVFDSFPCIKKGKRVAVYVGAHNKWSDELRRNADSFCEAYNAVVLCDQTSNYKGKYRINYSLLMSQQRYEPRSVKADILIHIGAVSGAPAMKAAEVWRVNPDGEIRDTFRTLRYVFEMEESDFFKSMPSCKVIGNL